MQAIQIDTGKIDEHSMELVAERSVYRSNRENIIEAEYIGVGKAADIMQEMTGVCDDILNDLDELFGRSMTLLKNARQMWNAAEETNISILES